MCLITTAYILFPFDLQFYPFQYCGNIYNFESFVTHLYVKDHTWKKEDIQIYYTIRSAKWYLSWNIANFSFSNSRLFLWKHSSSYLSPMTLILWSKYPKADNEDIYMLMDPLNTVPIFGWNSLAQNMSTKTCAYDTIRQMNRK